ncbi:uncharacterized protein LOC143419557 isoform X1 [Maylandia zebra]|uniref:uncharacterized protein LOC143419557 isoform X1 n=1 Tax=Maylandia zebra TaxID=106582 RepID=UPI00403C5F8E
MESVPVRRRSCLLRFRERCPFRKLCRRTYDISAADSSPIDLPWNDVRFSSTKQPMLQMFPHLARCQSFSPPDQSDADTHMEEDLCAAENHQNHQSHQNQQQDAEGKADNHMELDDDVDPETGERAQG